MRSRPWTKEEFDYLEEAWGNVSIPRIAKKLNRSVDAIKIKSVRLGLGRHLHSGEYITFNQLMRSLGLNGGGYYRRFINSDFPFKEKKSVNKAFKIIYLEDFWKWAEENKYAIDFKNFKEGALGVEPKWVPIKRRSDIERSKVIKKTPWTAQEDKQLNWLVNQYRYGYTDIARLMNRSEQAIKRRLNDINIKARPLRADNNRKWEDWEIEILIKMLKKGYTHEDISKKLNGRSTSAIRGKIERMERDKWKSKIVESVEHLKQAQ